MFKKNDESIEYKVLTNMQYKQTHCFKMLLKVEEKIYVLCYE